VLAQGLPHGPERRLGHRLQCPTFARRPGASGKGLIDHQGAPRGDNPPPLRITRAGLQAIGVETEDDAPEGAPLADTGATSADVGAQAIDAAVTDAEHAAPRAKKKAGKSKARVSKAGSAHKRTPRAGIKQAQMIEMLKRAEGATVEQIAEATGWQYHTIRGAISGALKKKLGLTVEATRTREVGPEKTGAKGSSTVYRRMPAFSSTRIGLVHPNSTIEAAI
jgi:Protein of unknown function (DUF3489)